MYMRIIITYLFGASLLLASTTALAQTQRNEMLLNAVSFINTPYGVKTLDINNEEQLVLNTDEVDCVTLVENVLAMSLAENSQTLEVNEQQPELDACVHCGRILADNEPLFLDLRGGGLCCAACHQEQLAREAVVLRGRSASEGSARTDHLPLAAAQLAWLRMALRSGSASWVNAPDCYAPLQLLRRYVELRLDQPVRGASMLPAD